MSRVLKRNVKRAQVNLRNAEARLYETMQEVRPDRAQLRHGHNLVRRREGELRDAQAKLKADSQAKVQSKAR